MADKGIQPKKEMGVLDRFRLGTIDKFTVPVLGKLDRKKRDKPKRGRGGSVEKRGSRKIHWLSHQEMLKFHKRIKRNRRRNKIAKASRRRNRP